MADAPSQRNTVRVQRFSAEPNDPVYIGVGDIIPLMPFFKWDDVDQHYVDATGDYDLCMSEDGFRYKFINRRREAITFAFRFIQSNSLSKRLSP